jgi:hypothetical protein
MMLDSRRSVPGSQSSRQDTGYPIYGLTRKIITYYKSQLVIEDTVAV